ncbi:MAG TPA: leucine-rich repeat protein, partial [Bacteroidales bacterium]|nr:leucine-rich repeat protein [Bacteroidales bacterium]
PSVKIIKWSAFQYWGSLKHLDLGTSVEYIGSNAFSNCGMEAIQFSPEVKIIDNYAFMQCPNLKKLEIPNKTKIIGDMAFYKCPKLTQVTMTAVDSIGESAFRGCEELTSIALGDSLRILGNYAFHECTKIEGHIKFPKPLEYIGWKNFSGCRKITGIDLPDGLKGIGWEAFRECFGITKLTLPGELVAIGDGAFYNCWNIESKLIFPATLKNIGYRAFHNCEKLQGIDLKHASELESIGFQAFYGCDGLTGELWIPDAVTTIGLEAFWFCSGINSLYIGASLTEVGENAFISFPRGNLTSIIVNKNNPNYDSRKDCNAMIETATNTLYKGCCRTVIPETVTAIGDDAFLGCDIIGEINIPDAVTSIGDDAFYACHDITRINLSANNKLASIGEEAFAHCYRLREIPQLYSIVTIGDQAFEACHSMPGVIFGPNLKEIGRAAFNACGNLQHATFKSATPPTVGERAFIYDPEYSPYMFIPCNKTAAYQAAMPKQEKFIESDTYNVSVVSNDVEMGKVSYKSHDLCESNVVTVTATPEAGFRFLYWTGGISQNPCTFSVKGDIFLVAYFEANPEQEYTIRALSNDSTQGTVTGGGVYLENATATLTAVPKEGYQFIKWQDGNTDNPRSIVVTSDATFTAFFDVADGINQNQTAKVQIYTADKSIIIGNAEGKNVNIYDLTGQLLIKEASIASNNHVIHVRRQGIYFVKVGNGKAQKVLVK